ncbi:MAG: pyridoxal phosphate-dependent aminotransferase [Thermoleophilia bacterium]|nr:pyridoxal phosphate-dependent aminotransferase [Thermoleophilia bacterium]
MPVAKKIAEAAQHSSWIRQMFEEGARLAATHGRDKVFDFSIGNPNLEPPAEFQRVIEELVRDPAPGLHGYMSNAGYAFARSAVAAFLAQEQGVPTTGDHVVMTVGAGGSLNVVLKTVLDPGDEVIVPRPYFMEYDYYVDNHGGVLKPVDTTRDFQLDVDAIEAAIGSKTRAVLINSPNNPTGRVYPESAVRALGELLERRSRENGRLIYLVADEPYRRIVYDGVRVAPIMQAYAGTIIASSYSKELSLAGERIGFVAANPAIPEIGLVMEGLVMANRILGFVNAPSLMQRVVARLQGVSVDVAPYKRNRDLLCRGLTEAGFEVVKPEGAFYLFPRSPMEDDVAFCREMQKHLVLVVPGRGFGLAGHFRVAYCVAPEVVDGALPAFREVGAHYFGTRGGRSL